MSWFGRTTTTEDEAMVAGYMSGLAAAPLPVAPRLPGAQAVWVRAELLRRWQAQRQAMAPLTVMAHMQIAAVVAAALVLVVQVLGRG